MPIGEPVTWCHRMVICAKKIGKPRRTVDFQPLNMHAKRETHHTPSPFHQARYFPYDKKKTVLDTWNGYHSVPIREEDKHLTTFITPWGRYRYKTTPKATSALRRNRRQHTNFRPPLTHLPGHRLVENRTRLLVTTETLHLSHKSPILLSNRMANHARRKHSPTQQHHATPLWKEKPWPLQTLLTKPGTLSLDVMTSQLLSTISPF